MAMMELGTDRATDFLACLMNPQPPEFHRNELELKESGIIYLLQDRWLSVDHLFPTSPP